MKRVCPRNAGKLEECKAQAKTFDAGVVRNIHPGSTVKDGATWQSLRSTFAEMYAFLHTMVLTRFALCGIKRSTWFAVCTWEGARARVFECAWLRVRVYAYETLAEMYDF